MMVPKTEGRKSGGAAKAPFEVMAETLRGEISAKNREMPKVRQSEILGVARQMMKAGYEFTAETLGFLTDYLKGYNIWMLGSPGVGKSFFFECMNAVRRARCMSPILILNMTKIQTWSLREINDWMKTAENYDIVIDDPTENSEKMKVYGEDILLMQYLLECRIDVRDHRTHVITNYDVSGVKKNFKERVADRFVMLFKRCKFAASASNRKLKVWIRQEREGNAVL